MIQFQCALASIRRVFEIGVIAIYSHAIVMGDF